MRCATNSRDWYAQEYLLPLFAQPPAAADDFSFVRLADNSIYLIPYLEIFPVILYPNQHGIYFLQHIGTQPSAF